MGDEAPKPGPSTTRPFLIVRGTDITGVKTPTTYIETLIHSVKGYVGTGIFAMGDAFKNSGMILGPVLLAVIAVINLHCQHLLIKASVKIADQEPVEVLPSFAETVHYTFEDSAYDWLKKCGKAFGIMTDVFLILAEYGFCVCYFLFVAKHFTEIAVANGWHTNFRIMLAIILLPMWLSTFLGTLRLLTPLSLTSNILMWIGVGIVFYYTTSKHLDPITERRAVSYENLPLFFGICMFAFEGITFIIPLRMEMKNPQLFSSTFGVLNVGMAIVIVLYVVVGFLSFWQYGDDVKGSVFLNMPEHEWLAQTIKIIISIAIIFTFTLHMYIPFEIAYPKFYRKFGPFKYPLLVMAIYRTIPVLVTYALANISKNLGMFIALVGCLTGAVLAMILPCILELVADYGNLKVYIIIKNILIIVLGIVGGILGTVLCIKEIVEEYTKGDENEGTPKPK